MLNGGWLWDGCCMHGSGCTMYSNFATSALIAQLGERQTEDLKVLCSIHSQGTMHLLIHRNQTRSPIVWLTNSNKHIQTYLDIMLNLEK
jgi:hypothetical protein